MRSVRGHETLVGCGTEAPGELTPRESSSTPAAEVIQLSVRPLEASLRRPGDELYDDERDPTRSATAARTRRTRRCWPSCGRVERHAEVHEDEVEVTRQPWHLLQRVRDMERHDRVSARRKFSRALRAVSPSISTVTSVPPFLRSAMLIHKAP
jgi:hypothetical protein